MPRPRCSPRRRTRRSDTEELLLLGFEILVGDDALIPELGEPFELAHVLGFVRSRGRAVASASPGSSRLLKSWFIPSLLSTKERRRCMRHGPVGLPRLPPLCASFRHKSHLRSPSSLLVGLP